MDPVIEKAPSVLTNLSELGSELTRRTVLKGGASSAAALGLGALWSNHAFGSIGGPGGLTQRSPLLTLVNRVSQGYTQTEMNKASAGTYGSYLSSVLAGPASDVPGDAFLANLQPVISWTPFEAITNFGGDPDQLLAFSQQATIGLSVVSEKILLERMMDLWTNRLSVYGKKAGNGVLKNYGDYHIFRPNALRSFSRLLTRFAEDTSVLYYLDNVFSSGPIPNENWRASSWSSTRWGRTIRSRVSPTTPRPTCRRPPRPSRAGPGRKTSPSPTRLSSSSTRTSTYRGPRSSRE